MERSVLVVDDDAEIRHLLCNMLEYVGYTSLEAVDGLDALEKIRQFMPDVMILDVMMPRMDGITLCRQLRQDEATADLPIIMLSGKAQPNAVQEGLNAGANRYLTKPTGLAELAKSLHAVLHERPGAARPLA